MREKRTRLQALQVIVTGAFLALLCAIATGCAGVNLHN
jgi:hypothetical protein